MFEVFANWFANEIGKILLAGGGGGKLQVYVNIEQLLHFAHEQTQNGFCTILLMNKLRM